MADRVRRSQDDHGAARPRHPPLRYRRDGQRQLALQKPQLTATFGAFKNLSCAARASGRATPALRRTQRKAIFNKPASYYPTRASLFDADRGSLLNAVGHDTRILERVRRAYPVRARFDRSRSRGFSSLKLWPTARNVAMISALPDGKPARAGPPTGFVQCSHQWLRRHFQ